MPRLPAVPDVRRVRDGLHRLRVLGRGPVSLTRVRSDAEWAAIRAAEVLALRVRAAEVDGWATELVDPLVCRTPAYGHPAYPHCAACCGGTGVVVTCDAEQAIVDAVDALHEAARRLRRAADRIEADAAPASTSCACSSLLVDDVAGVVLHPSFACPFYGTRTPIDRGGR